MRKRRLAIPLRTRRIRAQTGLSCAVRALGAAEDTVSKADMRCHSASRQLVVLLLLASATVGARRTGGAKRGKSGRYTAGTARTQWHECLDYVEDTEHDCFPLCVRGAAFDCITAVHQTGGSLRADSQIYRHFDGNTMDCEAAGQRGVLELATKNDRSAFRLRWGSHTYDGKWVMHWNSVAEHHPHSDEQWCCAEALSSNETTAVEIDSTATAAAIPRRGDLTLHFDSFQPAVVKANEARPIQKLHTVDAGTSFDQPGEPRGLRCRGSSGWEPFGGAADIMPLWLADAGELNTRLQSCLCEMDFSACGPADTMKLKGLWDEPIPERLTDAVKGGFRLVDGRLSGDIQQDSDQCFYPWSQDVTLGSGRASVKDWSGSHQTGLIRAGLQVSRSDNVEEEVTAGATEQAVGSDIEGR